MTSRNCFISILIPVYNGAKTLSVCLESVFESAYTQFECIVVDDHSSDDTPAIAEKFNIRLVRLEKQMGAAFARNRGAEAAQGDVLLFIDSDVKIYPDSLNKIVKAFEENPGIAALFGSYDDQPGCPDFFSQYKNLFHHYTHQISRTEASTFWSGCGAIRREVFNEVGGFNQHRYANASIEDIELGSRLTSRGYRILLCKDLQVTHLKQWTFFSLLRADIFYRAVPWSKLMLERHKIIRDLNLQMSDRISAGLVCMSAGILPFSLFRPQLLYIILLLLTIVGVLNYKLYRFFLERKGWRFVASVFVMHMLYYLYSSLTFALCWIVHVFPWKKASG
jgi:glycosyltransferase involved in cell wall biosynthesis